MRFFANYTMRGSNQALFAICGFAIASPFIPIIGILAGLISTALFALVVLRKGGMEGLKVLFFSELVMGVFGAMLTGNALLGLAYGLLLWLPILPAALILREFSSLALAMESALALGVTIVIGFYSMVEDPAGYWKGKLMDLLQALSANAPESIDPVKMTGAIDPFTHYMTGAIVAESVLSLVLALLLARWLQAALYNPGGFRREFLNLRLHSVLVYAGLICILTGLIAGGGLIAELAWNVFGGFLVLFTINGVSILHAVLEGKRHWIVIMYMAWFFLPFIPWFLPLIAMLGMSDQWVNWRMRAKNS